MEPKTSKPTPKRRPIQRERAEQQALVSWFRFKYPNDLLFAIPNQLIRTPQQAINMARVGVVAGMPDLMIAAPRKPYHGVFIEMKAPKQGVESQVQAKIANILRAKGYMSVVCFGWDNARIIIEGYMEGVPWTATQSI